MGRTGIICALYFEAAALTPGKPPPQQPVELDEQTLLIVSGMGRERAKLAARKLLEENVERLICFGSAGALSPELEPGDVIQAEEVLGRGRKYAVNTFLPGPARQRLAQQNITVRTGPLACVDEEIAATGAKQALFRQTGALAADMESAGILDAAQHAGVPVSVLRVITDSADMALPAAMLRRIDAYGRINAPGLCLDLLLSPRQIAAATRLGCAACRAGRTMKRVARELRNGTGRLSKQSN